MLFHGSIVQMAEQASSVIVEVTLDLLRIQPLVVIAVPGGGSVVEIYNHLRSSPLPWDRIHMFLLDERLVPTHHPESNYKLIKDHLGSGVPPEVVHPLIHNVDNPAQSIADYEQQLERCGGRFDIVLASSGEDGHIGSLFPNHHSVEEKKKGYILLDDAPKPPPGRMSASYELIRQADTGIVLFFGSGKSNALRNFLKNELSYKECPAKIIAKLPHYYLFTDQEVETS